MIDREDLVFATCSQLAGEIKIDWDSERPEKVDQALKILHVIDEPDTTNLTTTSIVQPIGETESSATKKLALIGTFQLTIDAFKVVLANSDAWKTKVAAAVKKEIICRIKQYENQITKLSTPVPAICEIKL